MYEIECCEAHHVHGSLIQQIKDGMPGESVLQDLADFYKVFGDMTRIKILCVLFQSELCVCDLAEVTGMTLSLSAKYFDIAYLSAKKKDGIIHR